MIKNIYGQTPSTVYSIIRDNVLNNSSTSFDINKFDFVNELLPLSKKEEEYYNNMINYYNSKKNNDGNHLNYIKSFNNLLTNYNNELIRLNLISQDHLDETEDESDECDSCDTYNLPSNSEDDCKLEYEILDQQFDINFQGEMRKIMCENKLLDLTYGLLQLRLGINLLMDLNNDENLSIYERNKLNYELIKEKWESLTDDNRNARIMQHKTIELVNPCDKSLFEWVNFSIA
jgi:hypothetical protein